MARSGGWPQSASFTSVVPEPRGELDPVGHSTLLTMFPQLFGLAGVLTPSLPLYIDLLCTFLTGGSVAKILKREQRRRLRRKTLSSHYARCLEDFPELAAR